MVDDKLFNFLVSRVQSREAVSLSLATITSSASLILIAIFFTIEQEIQSLTIILGILFPFIALMYIETTYRGVHVYDHEWIRKLIAEEHIHDKKNRHVKETEDILLYTKNRILKIILVRLVFALPIFGWFFIIDHILNANYLFGIITSIISLGVIYALYSKKEIKDLSEDDIKRE